MRLGIIAGTSLVLVVACSGEPPRTARAIRTVDLDAWSGAPLTELATHPVFSTWQHNARKLSDGREVWTRTKCESGTTPVICASGPGIGNAPAFTMQPFTPAPFVPPPGPPHIPHHMPHHMPPQMPLPFPTCRGGDSYEICCQAQFVIRESYVESSRAVGNCVTDCRHRPGSRRCGAEPSATMAPSPDPMLGEIRKMPSPPAIGASHAQVRATCGQQRGQLTESEGTAICRVGGDAIFVCKHDEQQVVQCDTFFEKGDIAAFRAVAEKRFGPPADVDVPASGRRVFVWPSAGYALTTYPKGVQVTVTLVPR